MKTNNKKPDYKHGKFQLASTNILNYEYNEFVSDWKDMHANEEDIPSESSDEFWDWATQTRDWELETDLDNIEECNAYNVPVAMTGSAGLWDGRHSYIAQKFDSIIEAIRAIIRGGDFLDFDIHFNNGVIEIEGHHHDGTNCYELHALSKKGLAKVNAALNRYEDIPELKTHDFKRLPYLYAL